MVRTTRNKLLRTRNKRKTLAFEFNDASWLPDCIRNGITDYLKFAIKVSGIYNCILPVIERGLKEKRTFIDLCSGSGGAAEVLYGKLKKPVRLRLSDKYPYREWKNEYGGNIHYLLTPYNALHCRAEKFKTMFTAMHHFTPSQIKKIMAAAADSGYPIAFFEVTRRNLLYIVLMLLTPVAVLLSLPFQKFRWCDWLCFPLVALCATWDGVVSCLRSYSKEEMLAMGDKRYRWECKDVGAVRYLYGEAL